jgi:hypothetical protein
MKEQASDLLVVMCAGLTRASIGKKVFAKIDGLPDQVQQ